MPPDRPLNQRIEEYLDGLLTPTETQRFEEILHEDTALRDEVNLQREIDDVLRTVFVTSETSPEAVLEGLPNAAEPRAGSGGWFSRPSGRLVGTLAAVVALVAWLLVASVWWRDAHQHVEVAYVPQTFEAIYDEEVSHGFHEYWVCDEPERFAATFYLRHGQALHLRDLPPGLAMKGLSYLGGLSRDTTAMLAVVEGQPVLVFIDDEQHDRPLPPAAPDAARLHRFRRQLGQLVLYEVTPLEQPHILEFLEMVDPPRKFLEKLPSGRARFELAPSS